MNLIKIKKQDFEIINKIAVPILISSFAEVIFNIADQAIVGRTNVFGYAAVGIASNLIYMLTGTFGILSLAFNILFGKALGNNDKEKSQKVFETAMTTSIIIGIVFGLLCLIFGKIFLSKIYGLEAEMLEYAYDYLKIASWGLGLNMIIFVFSAYFKNMGKTEVNFKATIISLTINFLIDYILVFGKLGFPRLGIKGAAIGTVIGLIIYVCIYMKHFRKIDFIHYRLSITKDCFNKLIKLYIPLWGQDFIEGTLFIIIITAIISRFNVYSVASYNLLESIVSIVTLPIFAYAGVALTLVTQNIEKKDTQNIKNYCVAAYLCSLLAVILVGGIFVLFPQETSKIITNDRKLVETVSSLYMLAVPIQIFNIANQLFKYCLQGISQEKWVLYFSTIVSAISCIVIFLLSNILKLGLAGVYVGMAISYSILGIGYFLKFAKILNHGGKQFKRRCD